MAKQKRKIPRFDSPEQEREFWAKADSTDYIDWAKAAEVAFPKLKPSRRVIGRVDERK